MTRETTNIAGHVQLIRTINDFISRALLLYALAIYVRLVSVSSTFRQRDFMSKIS
jgi:hypothetical protein